MMNRIRSFIERMGEAWKEGGLRGALALVRSRYITRLCEIWARWWMRRAGLTRFGRLATRLAVAVPLPYQEYYEKQGLASFSDFGYVDPTVTIHHDDVKLGPNIFIDRRVEFQQDTGGGRIKLGNRAWIGSETLIRTGQGGAITIGSLTSVGIRCELTSYVADIQIGSQVMIASNCRFFSYDHGMNPDVIMQEQQLKTKGPIIIEDDVWLGTGTIILSGVRIGKGAVIGAGSVVTKPVPPGTIAAGNPARILKRRGVHERDVLVDIEHDALLVRGLDGTIRFWNKGAEHLYGWQSQDTLGKRSHNLFQTIFPQPLESIEEQLVHEGYWEGELLHIRRDGSRLAVKSRWEMQYDGHDDSCTVIEINSVYT
ncbi:MAG: DapH/DapD/GlmU-related protein [Nitrospiraceae bacterium]